MAQIKPSLPKGTHDFSPEAMVKRNFIIETIRAAFQQFGFVQIETPAMENLGTLAGKYGEEGDRLLFKILNSGDYLAKANEDALKNRDSRTLTSSIAEKGLHYDLTVPLARYVVMHQNEIAFPFRRYQIQPVWRADRPQKGRYREFWQCDADVIGSDSLISEVELIQIYADVFEKLNLDVVIKLNNRKVLSGFAELAGIVDRFIDFTVSVDKLDKIGKEGVLKELGNREFDPEQISNVENVLFNPDVTTFRSFVSESAKGKQGLEELDYITGKLDKFGITNYQVEFQLARGLDYYTGTIVEVLSSDPSIGSISAGGRYDDLTGLFGLPGVSGVGISFGLDRIYDIMNSLNAYPELPSETSKVLFVSFNDQTLQFAFDLVQQVRQADIKSEIYPSPAKLKKQMKYADQKKIPFVILVGEEEMQSGKLTMKNMESGDQVKLTIDEIIEQLR